MTAIIVPHLNRDGNFGLSEAVKCFVFFSIWLVSSKEHHLNYLRLEMLSHLIFFNHLRY